MVKLHRKVVIAVAPAARHGDEKSERKGAEQTFLSVMTPDEIARDVIECSKNGATLIHMHVRDEKGHLTDNLTQFVHTISMITEKCDVIIEGSTGGVSELTAEERGGVLNIPEVQVAAINMGSVNLGEAAFVNKPEDIRLWLKMMVDRKVVPIMECFEPGMLQTVNNLLEEGVLKPPYVYGIPMGFAGSQPARTANMQLMADIMPNDAVWYYQQHGMMDLAMIASAIVAGAKVVRVGFEDSIYYAPEKHAKSNAELVEKLAQLIHMIGYEVATPEEARKILQVQKN